MENKMAVDISVVMPVRNAAKWLPECLQSLLDQSYGGPMELSVFDDGSTDSSTEIIASFKPKLEVRRMRVICTGHILEKPRGPGYAKNRAVEQSSGDYLCFLDSDDVMHKNRIRDQYLAAQQSYKANGYHHLVGCRFSRVPASSTDRYTRWCNSLSPQQLYSQAFTAFGPTIIQPTWFLHRSIYTAAGPYSEEGPGTPEDLLFFYKHLSLGGKLQLVDEELLVYRYHEEATSLGVDRWVIWDERVRALEKFVLANWTHFTIWNAGKQGRRLYRSLSHQNRAKVVSFCDVDEKKIARGHYIYEESEESPKPRVPIVHYSKAKPPFVLCVKWDLTGGVFEEILGSLALREGIDYINFS